MRESAAGLPPRSTEGLADHLAASHGIEVTGLSELDLGVFRVGRAEGEPWVARVFPTARPLAEAEGDAAVLRGLERAGFPAARGTTSSPKARRATRSRPRCPCWATSVGHPN